MCDILAGYLVIKMTKNRVSTRERCLENAFLTGKWASILKTDWEEENSVDEVIWMPIKTERDVKH